MRLALALLLLCACDDAKLYAFRARKLDPVKGCLERATALAVAEGDAGTCAPIKCLVAREDGASVAYVTSDCPPYPPGLDPTENDPRCPIAKAAWDRNDTCTDAGSTRPLDASSD